MLYGWSVWDAITGTLRDLANGDRLAWTIVGLFLFFVGVVATCIVPPIWVVLRAYKNQRLQQWEREDRTRERNENSLVPSNARLDLEVTEPMTAEQLHTRYLTEIDKRGRDDKYIDGIEERELMQIAIQHGFAPERARAFLAEVCREKGYIIEAAVVQQIRDKLNQHSQTGRPLAQSVFETIVRDAKQLVSATTRSDQEVRRLVVNTIDDCGLKCRKKWGLFDWFAKTKQRLGLG